MKVFFERREPETIILRMLKIRGSRGPLECEASLSFNYDASKNNKIKSAWADRFAARGRRVSLPFEMSDEWKNSEIRE